MTEDPLSDWLGESPYEVLKLAGVTPDMTHKDMGNVSFTLMRKRMFTTRTRKAWEELRLIRRRMLVDLMRYDTDLAVEIAAVKTRTEKELANPESHAAETVYAISLKPQVPDDLQRRADELARQLPGASDVPAFLPADLIIRLTPFDK